MKYKLYKDTAGQWRWRLIAANGKILADSGQGYAYKADCEHDIQLVKSSASAPVEES